MNFQTIIRHKAFVPAVVGAVAFGSGAVAGYFTGQKRMFKNIRTDLDEKVETIIVTEKDDFQFKLFVEQSDEDGNVNIVPLFKNSIEPETAEMVETVREVLEEANIFENVIEGWDYEEELKARKEAAIYIIHRDEFYGDELSWDNQHSLTWYAGDEILCTEDDSVVYNPHLMIGLLQFGHGSGDPDVCFIRNENLHAEYEVFRNPGSYAIEVLGGTIEAQMAAEDLRHSRSPGKFPRD
jgi:hypothetical protein